MTNEEYASLIAGYTPNATKDILQEKIDKLNQRTVEKIDKLGNKSSQDTVIKGLYDADSPVWANPNGRKSTARLTGEGYYVNAPELKVNNELNPAGINARIQADNFAMGVDAPNFPEGEGLDPKYYQQYVDAINPVIAQRQAEGQYVVTPVDKQGRYGRELVTAKSAELPMSQTDYLLAKEQGVKKFLDPNLKKIAGTSALDKLINNASDQDGMIGESVDIAQSSLIQQYAGTVSALNNGVRWLAGKVGMDEKTVDEWIPKDVKIGLIEGGHTANELSQPDLADKIAGVKIETRKDQQETMKIAQKNLEDGNYLNATGNVFSVLPYMLGDSTGEITALALGTPGLVSAIGNRVNTDAEEYKKNNNVNEVDASWLLGSTVLNTAALVSEKFLIKTGLNSVIKKGVTKAGKTGAIVESTVGEALQEAFDQTQQTYMTQKDGEKTLGEIVGSSETAMAALAGGVMGGTLRGTGEVSAKVVKAIPGVLDATKKGLEKATETPVQKKQRETREFSAPIQEEAITAIMTGASEEVVSRVEKIHGKLVDNLDESASKKRTYGTVIKNALERAVKSGDENAINNVYKTIAELDKSDADFQAKDLVDESAYSATQEFLKIINQNTDTSDSKIQELRKQSTEDITEKSNKRESILNEVKSLEARIEAEEKRLKSVMGSDEFDNISGDLTKLKGIVGNYISGKDTDAVNSEFSELGFIVAEGANGLQADPSRPGLKVYEKELQDQLLNTKTNKNLLDEKVTKGARVKLTGLTKFAESRLKKLNPTTKKESFQTSGLINSLFKENEQMLETINTVLKTAQGLKSVDETTRKAYEDELKAAEKVALEANKELTRRKAILDSITEKGTFVFQVNTDGSETIQKVTGKDSEGKFQKVKFADVIDDKVVTLNKSTETVTNTKNTKPVEPKEVTKVTKQWVQKQLDAGKSVEEVRAMVDANSNLSPVYRSNVGKHLDTLVKPEEKPADIEVPVEQTKAKVETTNKGSIPDKTANKEEYYAEAPKVVEPVKSEVVPPKTPLGEVRIRIAYVNEELSNLIANVPDMEVKKHVKEHYTKKLEELQEDRSKFGTLIDRLEVTLNNRIARKYNHKDLKLITAIVAQIDRLVSKMLHQINRLHKMLKKTNKQYSRLATEMKTILQEIKDIEKDFTSEPVKTTIGTVTKIDEELYGVPVVDVDDTRIVANKRLNKKNGKLVAQSTAINDALELVKLDKMAELRDELKAMPKGETSLSAKLTGRLLLNFPMNSAVHKIVKRGTDSVFGKLTGNTFANPTKLLELLPKSFKEFFASDKESREALIENMETMATYLDNTKIGDIQIGKNRLGKHIDYNGLAMLNRPNPEGGEYNFPVEVLELIGTVKDGVLQIDEQTENILKFYTAKMLGDSQTMIGKILSFDESEMSQYLGITDPDEQIAVKQEAAQGYVNSASIRKDIGSEVYQSLGIRFNEITPEFTEESFKSALGVLVQAIATDNGSMTSKSGGFGGKNQTLVKVTWDSIGVEKEPLIKAINKLQYMNENRSRPLPSLREPADDNNRMVMNTQNQMDQKSIDFLNKQEKIAYTISPRLQRWLDMDETEALKSMGYVNVETAGLHVSEIDAQIARNDKLVREWDILKTFAKSVGNKKFYTKWGQTVSGRYTILSDIQYQESKLHREFVVAEGSVESVDPTKDDARQMLEASIMQGLDMDPDKLSAETATENFNKLFKVTDKGIEVSEEGPIKQAYEAMRDGKVDAEAMAEVFADSEGHHGISSIELLVDWDKALKNGNKINTHANLEIDAITSGMILTLLQIGSDQAIRLAEKGGIYTKERKPELEAYVKHWLGKEVEFTPGALIEAGKKHASAIENGDNAELLKGQETDLNNDKVFKDLYSTIGVAMIGEVEAYKTALEDKVDLDESEIQQLAMLNQIGTLNVKNIRSIAKSPVMVYIYGATINSIKNKLTYSLGVDTLVKAIKTASKLLKAGKDATKELEFVQQFIPTDKEKYVDGFGIKVDKPKERWEQLLALDIQDTIEPIDSAIRATFGTGIETAFGEKLGFVDRNRDAAKSIEMLVFQAYQVRLADEVNKMLDEKYGPERHKGESYKLSKEDMQNINNRLTEQGFGHNIVWDEESGRVNQSLNKTGNKGGDYSTNVTVGKTKVGGQIKQFKPLVNTGAAPTISIHAIDGRMMLDVLNRELNKYTGGNVYDAVVLSLNKSMLTDTADSYNTNMIETGFNRSVVANQLGMLENMLSTMSDEQKVKMFNSIGLRPEGELREDYTKEANRLNLSIGKMLERIELAEEVNKERLVNSANGYYSGHLFQMGSGLVEVNSAETRAKEFPAIESVKKLLKNRMAQDRKVTQKEFGDKLNAKTNYVFNLNDLANMKPLVEAKKLNSVGSKANVIELGLSKKNKPTVKHSNVESLSANDVVEVIGMYKPTDKKSSSNYWFAEIKKQLLKSDAGIISRADLSSEGRQLVDGVWVKVKKDVKQEPKQETTKGFQGYKGGFDPKGKGTVEGDGKDKAMREVADGFIGELNPAIESSTNTSWSTIGKNGKSTINKNRWTVYGKNKAKVVMLAKNSKSKLANAETLVKQTKEAILEAHKSSSRFVVGDMPGIDSQFIEYLDEIGAEYTIYHTGTKPRIQKDTAKQEEDIIAPSETFTKNVKNKIKC